MEFSRKQAINVCACAHTDTESYIRWSFMFKNKITSLETNYPQHSIKAAHEEILYRALKKENCLKFTWGQGRGNLDSRAQCLQEHRGVHYTFNSSGSYYPSNQWLKSNSGSQVLASTSFWFSGLGRGLRMCFWQAPSCTDIDATGPGITHQEPLLNYKFRGKKTPQAMTNRKERYKLKAVRHLFQWLRQTFS